MQARPPARAWAGGARRLLGAAGVCLLAGTLLEAAFASRNAPADVDAGAGERAVHVSTSSGSRSGAPASTARTDDAMATEAEARAVCGVTCHRFPPPDILPRRAWRNEILLMSRLRDERARSEAAGDAGTQVRPQQDAPRASARGALARGAPDGQPPLSPPLPKDFRRVLALYERHAPKELPPADPWPEVDAGDVTPASEIASAGTARRAGNAAPRGDPAEQHVAASARTAASAERAAPNAATAAARPRFARRFFAPADDPRTPAVSNVRFADVDGDARLEVLGCDMRYGLIFLLRPYAPADPMRVIAQAPAPAHVTLADVDGDGLSDLLVADLGTFQPSDRLDGAALWLRAVAVHAPDAPSSAQSAQERLAPERLAPEPSLPERSSPEESSAAPSSPERSSGARAPREPAPGARALNFLPTRLARLPRVADAESADLDGDGLPDLIVSAFGWRRTGALSWWRASQSTPRFTTPTVLDPRPGAIHTIPVDLDGDDDVDLVAVMAQEHEEVLAWINDGRGRFDKRLIYAAPHPNWGSSGIQVVDLDQDSDLDVLLAHGDMFDDFIIKPYHGIQWLENRGAFPFTPHSLATLPGVHRAIAIDLDQDHDLDIVASTLIPEEAKERQNLPSLVWLEQTAPGRFSRHTLERGAPRHATLDAADFDQDGDIDLLVGNLVGRVPAPGWVELWENLSRPAAPARANAPPPPR